MARTFSYQKQHRNRRQPTLLASWRVPPPERSARGPFAELSDKVRVHRLAMLGKHEPTDTAGETDRQICPISD